MWLILKSMRQWPMEHMNRKQDKTNRLQAEKMYNKTSFSQPFIAITIYFSLSTLISHTVYSVWLGVRYQPSHNTMNNSVNRLAASRFAADLTKLNFMCFFSFLQSIHSIHFIVLLYLMWFNLIGTYSTSIYFTGLQSPSHNISDLT